MASTNRGEEDGYTDPVLNLFTYNGPDSKKHAQGRRLPDVRVLKARRELLPLEQRLARGGTVSLTDNGSDARKTTAQIPKQRPMAANASVSSRAGGTESWPADLSSSSRAAGSVTCRPAGGSGRRGRRA
jgi:hypothetical protein